jgi:hypothetical protein
MLAGRVSSKTKTLHFKIYKMVEEGTWMDFEEDVKKDNFIAGNKLNERTARMREPRVQSPDRQSSPWTRSRLMRII